MTIYNEKQIEGLLKRQSDSLVTQSPIPSNISYMWNFGSLLGGTFLIQVVSGVSVSFHYIANTNMAFNSVQYIMTEENYGWLLRYVHSNGASIFFIFVYIHIGRSLYYGSYYYPRNLLWNIGVIIFILMMAIAFLGYVLVWGSMSLWGAIVITNFFSTIPWLGITIVNFIWGGFAVDYPTLIRFYSLHFTLPWILFFFIFIHILALHEVGSNNPTGQQSKSSSERFHPLFSYKDYITFIILPMILILLVGFYPNLLSHPDNYIKANPLVTPNSIVPEWYFLPFYGILRSIPSKSYGVMAMGLSILVLFLLPLITPGYVRSNSFKILSVLCYWYFIVNFIILLIVGSLPVDYPYTVLGQLCTYNYFNILLYTPYSIIQILYLLYISF